MNTLERFLNKVDKNGPNGCWIWTAAKVNGYGVFHWIDNKKQHSAHRYSAKHLAGLDIGGMLVCHKCDNPSCVNPDHLFLGTPADNMLDKVAKGRQRQNPKKTIQTPLGIFESSIAAAKAHNKSRKYIWNRLKRFPDLYKYL